VAHARSLGAVASRVRGVAELSSSLSAARQVDRTCVLVIETDWALSTTAGGHWWDVPVPEVSERAEVRAAREGYAAARRSRSDDPDPINDP
jgi:3D-(3,5/4)-trihydroxycyclohexane-1,2-dione acylhydrolase (decyclizing)